MMSMRRQTQEQAKTTPESADIRISTFLLFWGGQEAMKEFLGELYFK